MGLNFSKESQSLLQSANHGDAQRVASCLLSDPRLLKSVTFIKRSSVLHLAARNGHTKVLEAIVQPLVDDVLDDASGNQQAQSVSRLRKALNARDLYFRTPLLVAAKKGHLDCVKVLLEKGANLFSIDRDANTCLHYAALTGQPMIVEYLISRTAARDLTARFVNKLNVTGFTALHYAVWGNHAEVAQQLILNGADYTISSDRVFDNWVPVPIGTTALHLAVIRNSSTIVWMILEQYASDLLNLSVDDPELIDPRELVNVYGLNAAQLAAHLHYRRLARMLLPQLSVLQLFEPEDIDRLVRKRFGPVSLRSIAATVLQEHLWGQVDHVVAQEQLLCGGNSFHDLVQQDDILTSAADGDVRCATSHIAVDGRTLIPEITSGLEGSTSNDTRGSASVGNAPEGYNASQGLDSGPQGSTNSQGLTSAAVAGVSNVGGRLRQMVAKANLGGNWVSCLSPDISRMPSEASTIAPQQPGAAAAAMAAMTGEGCCCSINDDTHRQLATAASGGSCSSSQGGDADISCGVAGMHADVSKVVQRFDSANMDQDPAHIMYMMRVQQLSTAQLATTSADVEEGVCCLCTEGRAIVEVVGCGHVMCTSCARRVSEIRALKPPLCPFCRRPIKQLAMAQELTSLKRKHG
eukprot:jgi/Chrzof1/8404/Cz03g09120.t1